MPFTFGEKSLRELQGVHPALVAVAHRALELSPVDFGVHDGLRTEAEQREYVRSGVSDTMNSRHLTGHAVDLVPYVNGKLRWEWEPIFRIAAAVRIAAVELKTPIIWGGCWDRVFNSTRGTPREESEEYVARRVALGKRVFIDGPHFELDRHAYP